MPRPQRLATADFSTISTVLPFPERHGVEIIQYADFSAWLLSLSIVYLSFFHVFPWPDSAEQYSVVWKDQFIYPFTYQGTSGLLPSLGNYESERWKHHVQVSCGHVLSSPG